MREGGGLREREIRLKIRGKLMLRGQYRFKDIDLFYLYSYNYAIKT